MSPSLQGRVNVSGNSKQGGELSPTRYEDVSGILKTTARILSLAVRYAEGRNGWMNAEYGARSRLDIHISRCTREARQGSRYLRDAGYFPARLLCSIPTSLSLTWKLKLLQAIVHASPPIARVHQDCLEMERRLMEGRACLEYVL